VVHLAVGAQELAPHRPGRRRWPILIPMKLRMNSAGASVHGIVAARSFDPIVLVAERDASLVGNIEATAEAGQDISYAAKCDRVQELAKIVMADNHPILRFSAEVLPRFSTS
jgi:hypothetical protein